MNILYIGPYRDNRYKNECNNHIVSLREIKSVNLNISPIYLEESIQTELSRDILAVESQNYSSKDYDIVIQYAPMEYLIPFKQIAKRNYCIPIVKYHKNIESNRNKILGQFDNILVDSKYDSEFISDLTGTKKNKKIKIFRYQEYNAASKLLNLFEHTNNYKLYTMVTNDNLYYLNAILMSFLIATKDVSKCSFIIFTESVDIANKINSIIDQIQRKYKLNSIKNYIKIITIKNTLDNLLAIHNTCDCYIELRPNTNSYMNVFLAKHFGNSVITNENMDLEYEPMLDNGNSQFDVLFPYPSPSCISLKIKNSINTKPIHKIDTIQTIDEILCN